MDIRRRIRTGRGFTPTEQQLGNTVLALGERLQGLSTGRPSAGCRPLGMLPACFAGVVLLCSAPLAALLHCANGYR